MAGSLDKIWPGSCSSILNVETLLGENICTPAEVGCIAYSAVQLGQPLALSNLAQGVLLGQFLGREVS